MKRSNDEIDADVDSTINIKISDVKGKIRCNMPSLAKIF